MGDATKILRTFVIVDPLADSWQVLFAAMTFTKLALFVACFAMNSLKSEAKLSAYTLVPVANIATRATRMPNGVELNYANSNVLSSAIARTMGVRSRPARYIPWWKESNVIIFN